MDHSYSWVKFLPWAEYAYNTSCHEGSGISPFEVVYGHVPPTIFAFVRSTMKLDAVESELVTKDEFLIVMHANLFKAQQCMKKYVDQHFLDDV